MEIPLSELKALLCPQGPVAPTRDARREIVVADRGWVFVANVTESPSGDLTLMDGYCVRIWGTTKGLGQLAIEGAQPGTKLDPIPTTVVPARAVVARMAVAPGVRL